LERGGHYDIDWFEVVVFEPMLPEASFFGSRVITDLAGKVYTRDLFGGDF
jgi:hypothetical protein